MTPRYLRTAGTRRLLAALSFWLAAMAPALAETCVESRIDVRTDLGVARFYVEIADEPGERSQGLMRRTELPEGSGMLFLFDRAEQQVFWMKDTPLPLDIIFIDDRGVVDSIAAETTPFSLEALPSDGPAIAVLEINGGLAARYGIEPGSEVRHPFFTGRDPAWPCE